MLTPYIVINNRQVHKLNNKPTHGLLPFFIVLKFKVLGNMT